MAKVFNVANAAKVYAYTEPVSMAYGFPRLSEYVVEKLKRDPANGDLFMFYNRHHNYVKILYYHEGVAHLHNARIPTGSAKFEVEDLSSRAMSIGDLEGVLTNVLMPTKRGRKLTVIEGRARRAA